MVVYDEFESNESLESDFQLTLIEDRANWEDYSGFDEDELTAYEKMIIIGMK